MIQERLEEFTKHVSILNDKYSIYTNEEKGITYPLNTPQLLCRVDKLELDKNEEAVAKYKKQIEDKEYTKVDIIKLVPKSEITKIDADKYIVTEKKTKGIVVYNVTNQIGIHSTFENQEEAFKLCEEMNKEVLPTLCK